MAAVYIKFCPFWTMQATQASSTPSIQGNFTGFSHLTAKYTLLTGLEGNVYLLDSRGLCGDEDPLWLPEPLTSGFFSPSGSSICSSLSRKGIANELKSCKCNTTRPITELEYIPIHVYSTCLKSQKAMYTFCCTLCCTCHKKSHIIMSKIHVPSTSKWSKHNLE